MVPKIRNVSLKRQRPFPDSSRNVMREPSQISLGEVSDLGPSFIDNNGMRPEHLQGLLNSDEKELMSRINRLWITPRITIASILNNKGVMYMERQQYEEACMSLNQALRITEEELRLCPDNSGKDEAEACASGDIGINCSIRSSEVRPREFKQYLVVEPPPGTGNVNEMLVPSAAAEKENLITNTDANNIKTNEFEKLLEPHASNQQCNSGEEKGRPDNVVNNNLQKKLNDSSHERILPSERQMSSYKSEYDEGMDCFKSPIRLLDSSLNLSSTILFNLGRASQNLGKFEDALCLYRRSLLSIEQRSSRGSSRDETLALAVLIGIGRIHYVQGDYIDSLNTYMTALAVAQSEFGENSLEVAACLNCIGVLHYMMSNGDDDIALDALKTSLQQRIKLLGKDHIDVGTTWNNVGRMYFQLGKFDLAMEAYCEALRIRQECQGESVDVAATLFNCGQVYHNLERRDKALSLFRKFLKLAKIHFGEFHRDICIVNTCIGQVLHECKDYKNALKSFKDALRIGNVALGPVHSEMAITLNKMGNLYYETGDFDSALKAYHEGLDIEIAVLETGDPNTHVTYTNIAEIHKQRGEYVKAMEYYQKVYELQLDHGAGTLELANTLSNIGDTKLHLEDLDGALEANQECLRLRRDVFGETHEDVASTLTHIALVFLKLERHGIALKVFLEAYRIRKTLPIPNKSNLAFTLYNIAHIYHYQGCHDNALKFYLATAEAEKGIGIAHLDLSITYFNMGKILYQRGEMELALARFTDALKIECEYYGRNHPTCARTLNEIGNVNMQLGNLGEMMKSYIQALRIYKKAGMVDEHLVVYSLRLWRFNIAHPEAAPVA